MTTPIDNNHEPASIPSVFGEPIDNNPTEALRAKVKDSLVNFLQAMDAEYKKPLLKRYFLEIYDSSADEILALITQTIQAEAEIKALTDLDNAFDEVTPERFHEYYLKKVGQFADLTKEKE